MFFTFFDKLSKFKKYSNMLSLNPLNAIFISFKLIEFKDFSLSINDSIFSCPFSDISPIFSRALTAISLTFSIID